MKYNVYNVWYAGKVVCTCTAPSYEDANEMVRAVYKPGVFGYPEAVLKS